MLYNTPDHECSAILQRNLPCNGNARALQPGMLVDQSQGKHTLELVIGDRVMSYLETVIQAVRKHASIEDPDNDHGLGESSIWTQTHTIWYVVLPFIPI